MARFIETELTLDHQYDPKTSRHYLNNQLSVLHCHHYATLYSQLADDVEFVDGKKLLADVAEDTFYSVLQEYFDANSIVTVNDKISIAEQYFAATGLGQMNVVYLGHESAEVELVHSHVDEGWIKKWGKRQAPVNFITQGYIAALVSLVNNKSTKNYQVIEEESIVSGAKRSLFKAVLQ
ncbi:MAG: hypothetical protein JXB48_14085 [Candidatus Latescibacteria bacterium]|nr:hypothetical protein [Candidatus Latescibacterota bacterium]